MHRYTCIVNIHIHGKYIIHIHNTTLLNVQRRVEDKVLTVSPQCIANIYPMI